MESFDLFSVFFAKIITGYELGYFKVPVRFQEADQSDQSRQYGHPNQVVAAKPASVTSSTVPSPDMEPESSNQFYQASNNIISWEHNQNWEQDSYGELKESSGGLGVVHQDNAGSKVRKPITILSSNSAFKFLKINYIFNKFN